jgi:hypothetical protein
MPRRSQKIWTSNSKHATRARRGDPTPAGPPDGVDPKASQAPAAIGVPVSPKPAKNANRSDVHRPGPSMKMQ